MKALDRTIKKLVIDGLSNVDDKTARQLIEFLISKGSWHEIKQLEKSGINLKINENSLQRLYSNLVKNGKISDILEIYKQTGIKPKLDLGQVDTATKLAAKHGHAEYIKALQELTGMHIRAPVPAATIHSIIARKDWTELILLMKRSANTEQVMEVCKNLIRKNYFDVAIRVSQATGVKFQLGENDAKKIYSHLMKEGNYQLIQEISSITGIKPKIEQMHLKKLLKEKRFSEAKSLAGFTDTSFLQQHIQNLISKGEIYDAKEISRLFNVKPFIDQLKFQEIFIKLLKRAEAGKIEFLCDLAGIKPRADYKLTQEVYQKLFAQGQFESIKSLEKLLGIPFDDTAHAFLSAIYFKEYDRAVQVYNANKLTIDKKVPKLPLLLSLLRGKFGIK